jgi:hypothetical protein
MLVDSDESSGTSLVGILIVILFADAEFWYRMGWLENLCAVIHEKNLGTLVDGDGLYFGAPIAGDRGTCLCASVGYDN